MQKPGMEVILNWKNLQHLGDCVLLGHWCCVITQCSEFSGSATVVPHSHALSHKSDTQEVQVYSNSWIFKTLLIVCTAALLFWLPIQVHPGLFNLAMRILGSCTLVQAALPDMLEKTLKEFHQWNINCSVWAKSNSTRVTCVGSVHADCI